jgi:Ca2+-binding EF-hand superfamily protein
MTQKKDVKDMREAFEDFDENRDGRLTKDELIKGMNRVMTPIERRLRWREL